VVCGQPTFKIVSDRPVIYEKWLSLEKQMNIFNHDIAEILLSDDKHQKSINQVNLHKLNKLKHFRQKGKNMLN
jgi:hypothetical protein